MTEGGIQAMSTTKLKIIFAAILVMAGFAGWAIAQTPAEKKAPAAEKPPAQAKLDLTPESFPKLHAPRPAAGERVAAPQGPVADRRGRGPEEGGRGGQADRHLLHRRGRVQRAARRLLKRRVSPPVRWFGPVHRRRDQAPQREVRLLRPGLVHQHQGRRLPGRVEAVLRRQAAPRRRERLAARHPAGADDLVRPAPRGRVKDRNGLATALQEVLDAYAKLPEAERRPKSVEGEIKPQPPPPPGGLVLTIYDRPLGARRGRPSTATPRATTAAASARTPRTASAARCG